MAVNSDIVRNAIHWLVVDSDYTEKFSGLSKKEWFNARNQWLKNQGIGGMVVDGKQVEEIPDWFFINNEFWFVNEAAETLFVLRWS